MPTPKLPKSKKRSRCVLVKFTPPERSDIAAAARAVKMPVATFVRVAAVRMAQREAR